MIYTVINKTMSTKNIIISLVGIIIIGGVVYFSMSQQKVTTSAPLPPVTIDATNSSNTGQSPEPTASASTNEIIDYIADGQQQDESKVIQSMLDASPETTEAPTINTNF